MFNTEMTCSAYCVIAVGFIFATIATCCLSSKNFQDFYSNLNTEQKKIKNEIASERFKIYITGILIGCVLAALFYTWIQHKGKAKICILVSIIMATSYFFYILSPKSKYMISYLKSGEQVEQWLKIYKQMQFNYHIGFLLGMSAIIALSASYC
jgi:hypothetical protein